MSKSIYSNEQNIIVEKLKKARIEAKLGQVEVAKILERTQSYISKIESGQRRIDIVTLKAFAKIYKKDLSYFLE